MFVFLKYTFSNFLLSKNTFLKFRLFKYIFEIFVFLNIKYIFKFPFFMHLSNFCHFKYIFVYECVLLKFSCFWNTFFEFFFLLTFLNIHFQISVFLRTLQKTSEWLTNWHSCHHLWAAAATTTPRSHQQRCRRRPRRRLGGASANAFVCRWCFYIFVVVVVAAAAASSSSFVYVCLIEYFLSLIFVCNCEKCFQNIFVKQQFFPQPTEGGEGWTAKSN